jgi:lipopolysaccharide export system permease protein
MVVWFASGLSLTRWIRPVMVFGIPIVLLTGTLAFYATPWAKQKSAEYAERFQKREDLQQVSPGQFRESASSNRIFFVEGVSGQTAVVHNVFVNTVDEKGTAVVVAKEGSIITARDGTRFLELKNGRRYQGKPGSPEFQTMEFDKYSMRVASQEAEMGSEVRFDAMPTAELIHADGPYAKAEILWRVSIPIMCVLLLLLAIPLGFVNPRAGSSANLIVALLVFFTYQNLVKVFEASVKQGKYVFGMAWWPLHLLVLLIVLGLFAWRANVNHRYHPRAMWARLKHGNRKGGAQ